MDDIADQKDIADEISQAITSPIGGGIEIDDDDLLKELEEMEQQVLDEKLVNVCIYYGVYGCRFMGLWGVGM